MSTKHAFLLALFTLLIGPAGQAQTPPYVPANGLLGWWPFNATPNDQSTNGNHFTNNGATNAPDRFGTANAAYQFNGTNSYLVNSAFSHTFSDTGGFSVSIWVKKASTSSGVAMMSGTTAPGNFIWLVQGGASNMTFGTNKQQQAWFYVSTPFSVNVWTHYVGTYSGQVMRFYKNGVLVGTLNYTHTGTTQANLPLYVGRGVSGTYFNGVLDDIGVWSRALSDAEIGALYTGGCPDLVAAQPTNAQVNLGGLALFSVSTNASPASYQWQTDQGLGFQNVANGGQYIGATGPNLTVTNTTLLNNGQAFRCRIASGSCVDTSNVAVLTVNNTIGTPEFMAAAGLTVYPNPVNDQLMVQHEEGLAGAPYLLVDQAGRVMLAGTLGGTSTRLQLTTLPAGVYFLSIAHRRFKLVRE